MKTRTEKKKRCFVIMPFGTPEGYEEGHFQKIYKQIIEPAVTDAGFDAEKVDENLLSTDIVTKIFKGLTECEMAICDLSSKNPNVLYELGIRQAYNKPVLLIKDEKTDDIFDIGGLTTIQYESNRIYENVVYAKDLITEALKDHEKNAGNVVNIIKGRLGNIFQASEIPTGESMNSDDRIINLLKSLIDDVDSIKQQINAESTVKKVRSDIDLFIPELHNMLIRLTAIKNEGLANSDIMRINRLMDEIEYCLVRERIPESEMRRLRNRMDLFECKYKQELSSDSKVKLK